VQTDGDGYFALNSLVLGQKYDVNVTIRDENGGGGGMWRTVGQFTPPNVELVELGDLLLRPLRRPPTVDERIAEAFKIQDSQDPQRTALDRYWEAGQRARLTQQRILVVYGSPENQLARQFMKLRFDDREVRRALDPYVVLVVNSSDQAITEAKTLAQRLNQPPSDLDAEFALVVADVEDRTVAASLGTPDLVQNDALSKQALMTFLTTHAPAKLDARQLLDEALAEAKAQNKRILVQETATWCAPCLRLSRFLDKHRRTWEKDYIWIKMDHRWEHALEIMTELRGEARGGIPWYAVLDADGKVLATSNREEGSNIGFPGSAEGKRHFQQMLEQTAIRLSQQEIQQLVAGLEPQE
jgi:hypothetical protein